MERGRMNGLTPEYPPEYWLKCAEEVREEARGIKNLETKHEMEVIARLYERLAEHAERRLSRRLTE
jgi:hypothetical protein